MTPLYPAPEHLVDAVVAVTKNLLAHHGALVVRPTPQERIQALQEDVRPSRLVGREEGLHTFRRKASGLAFDGLMRSLP